MNAGFLNTFACYVMHNKTLVLLDIYLFLSLSFFSSCRLSVAHAFSYVGTVMCCNCFILKYNVLGYVKMFQYISIYIY
jgi:hypothetical protein